MRNPFKNFSKDESGATLVEYGVALLLAIVLGGGALVALANQTGTNMGAACDSLTNTGSSGVTIAENCTADGGGADAGGTDGGS